MTMDLGRPVPPGPSATGGSNNKKRVPWLVWLLLGVVALVLVCVTPFAVWLVVGTVRAEEGGKTPTAAVDGVMGGLSRWADADLLGIGSYLAGDHADELRERLATIRRQFLADDPTYSVEAHNFREVIDGDSAIVTVDVSLLWATGDAGAPLQESSAYPWVFHTVLAHGFGGGWKVTGIDIPPLCWVMIGC